VEHSEDGELFFSTEDATADLHRLTGWALDHGFTLDHLEVRQPSLEEVYLDLIGETETG
jgi:ABC-2 type transport system ATP-binding protein